MLAFDLCLIPLDTLQFYERLKKTNLEESAAREIAEMFKETSEGLSAELATRRDVELIVRKEIAQAKSEIIKWVAGMLVAQAAIIATLVKLF